VATDASPRAPITQGLSGSLHKRALELLWLATCLSALGRGWLHFSKDQPYWSLFWSEELIGAPLALVGLSWSAYVESPQVEGLLSAVVSCFGVFYLLCAALLARETALIIKTGELPSASPLLRRSLWCLFALQLFYVSCDWLSHSLYLPIWFEQSAQLSLPWLCLAVGFKSLQPSAHSSAIGLHLERAPITVTRLAISCTFLGHGAFALGIYPVPQDYVVMVMRTLSCEEQTALSLLWWAGALDVLTALAVWTPRSKLRVRWAALAYMLVWGTMTALGRVVGHWGLGTISQTLWHWIPELMWRLPHALIPWWLLTLEGGVRPSARWRAYLGASAMKREEER